MVSVSLLVVAMGVLAVAVRGDVPAKDGAACQLVVAAVRGIQEALQFDGHPA